MTTNLNLRPAVRAILVDPEDRVLLVRFRFEHHHVWAAPGGGIDRGETPLSGLKRELLEEAGLDLDSLGIDAGGQVAHRVHVFDLGGGYDGQEEWYYVMRVPAFEPAGRLTAAQLREENLHELRWWSVPDLLREVSPHADGTTRTASPHVACAPRDLPQVLLRWLRDGVPTEMVELDL